MKAYSIPICSFILVLATFDSNAEERDFIGVIAGSPESAEAVGLSKLNSEEQQALNTLFNHAYQLGAKSALKQNETTSRPQQPAAKEKPASKLQLYITKIEEDMDDILKLANGGIVEITRGFIGFVGLRKDAVLFKDNLSWKIWIEGKKVFNCDLLKSPVAYASSAGQKVYISEVKDNGKILIMLDGSVYEVDDYDTFDTLLWLGNSYALLIDGTRLLNLDERSEIIDVTRLR